MTQVALPSFVPLVGPNIRSLFDANRSGDAPAGLGSVLGDRGGVGLPAIAELLLRNTQSLFDDRSGQPGGAAAGGKAVDASANGARGIGSQFDVADVLDKVGGVLKSLISKLFGDFNFGSVLKGLEDQVKNVLSAPFDGRTGDNLAAAGASFASFRGVEVEFQTDGTHTQLHIKQSSAEAAYGFGATADGSLAYRLGSFSSETNDLTIDLYAKGDEQSVAAVFQHTSLDVVAAEAVRRGPVALPGGGGQSPTGSVQAANGQRSLAQRFLDLFASPPFGDEGKVRPAPVDRPEKPRALVVIDADKTKFPLPVVEGSRLKLSLDMVLPIDLSLRQQAAGEAKVQPDAGQGKAGQGKVGHSVNAKLDLKI
jgi:hypothetical protein